MKEFSLFMIGFMVGSGLLFGIAFTSAGGFHDKYVCEIQYSKPCGLTGWVPVK